jgi:flagellar biosynthesis protein FlhF
VYLKRFTAATVPEALAALKRELGPDALVVETRSGEGMVTVAALAERPAPGATPLEPETPGEVALDEMRAFLTGALQREREGVWRCIAEELAALRAEVGHLRAAGNLPSVELDGPARSLFDEMVSRGTAPDLAERVTRTAMADLGSDAIRRPERLRAHAGVLLAAAGVKTPGEERETGRILILAGAPGVGKTTTAAKIAARETIERDRSVLLVSADSHRLEAGAQLSAYGRALDVPVATLDDPAGLPRLIGDHETVETIIVDTAGLPAGDTGRRDEIARLRRACPEARLELLLAADAEAASLHALLERFRPLQPDQAGLTRLDEAAQPATVLSPLVQSRLPVVHLSAGPTVPNDLTLASPARLAALALPHPTGVGAA